MPATSLQRIQPIGSRYETYVLLLLLVAILSSQAIYVKFLGQDESEEVLLSWQISSFNSFEGADQAVYNALYTVKDEIPYIYDDLNYFNQAGQKFRWPNVEDFQYYILPPFYHDTSWKQNGSIEWILHEPLAEGEMQGYIFYLGTNGQLEDQGSFLLTIGHVHAGFQNNNAIDIWWNPSREVEMPESGFRDALIVDGWKYVVPYSGDKEVERLFGDDA